MSFQWFLEKFVVHILSQIWMIARQIYISVFFFGAACPRDVTSLQYSLTTCKRCYLRFVLWQRGRTGTSRMWLVNPADQPPHPWPGSGFAECRGPGRTARRLPRVTAELPGTDVEQRTPAAGPRRADTHSCQGWGRQLASPGTSISTALLPLWPGSVMVRALELWFKRCTCNLRPFRYQVTTVSDKLFAHLSPSSINWYYYFASAVVTTEFSQLTASSSSSGRIVSPPSNYFELGLHAGVHNVAHGRWLCEPPLVEWGFAGPWPLQKPFNKDYARKIKAWLTGGGIYHYLMVGYGSWLVLSTG